MRDAVSGELRVPVEIVRRAFEEIRGGERAGDAAAARLTQRERVNAGVGALVRAERTAG